MFDAVTDEDTCLQAVEIQDDMWLARAFKPHRSWVMKKQRGVTQAEKAFDAAVAQFNQEARKLMDDRSLTMSAKRRLISLRGKALLRPAGSNSQPTTP